MELAGIWADVLELEEVDLDDDFVELGGSSLLAVRVMRRLNRHFGVELPLRALFEAPTVAGLALSVTRTVKEAPASPVSPGQRDLWFGEQRRPGLYPGTPALRLRGPLDVPALEASLGEICARHEALRTTFGTRDGEPVQIVGPPRPSRLTPVDVRELPHPVREEEAARLLAREAQRPFDLACDPMLRPMVLRLDDEEHLLLVVIHHIACDAWSLDLLFNELEVFYWHSRSGQRAKLPELPVQYADYAIWQGERLRDGTLRASVEYWKGQLARPPQALDLSRDRPRPPVGTSGGAWEELRLPASVPGELHALGRRHDATLFMTLLSAWLTLLHRRYGADDILILTPFANRQRVEVEGLIGLFANNLILRQDLAGDPSFAELLGRVRKTAVDALSHCELPFEELPEGARSTLQTAFFMPPRSSPRLDGLDAKRVEIDHGARLLPLGLFIIRQDDGLTARLNYDRGELAGPTAARMLDDYMNLLRSIVADSHQRVSQVSPPS